MIGPTRVPCRVSTASTATARQLIRFITLSSTPVSSWSSAAASQPSRSVMKNVVLPESPQGSCTTRSSPSPVRAGQLEQLVVVGHGAQHVGHAGHPGLVAHPGGDQLGVHPVPQLGRRQRDLDAQLAGQPLGLLVEHHQHGLAAGALLLHEVVELGVGQQVVVHLLHRGEVVVAPALRDEHPRVRAAERVVVVDVGEVADPAVDAEQVERGRRDEVDRRLVAPEERPDRRHPAQRLARRAPVARGAGVTGARGAAARRSPRGGVAALAFTEETAFFAALPPWPCSRWSWSRPSLPLLRDTVDLDDQLSTIGNYRSERCGGETQGVAEECRRRAAAGGRTAAGRAAGRRWAGRPGRCRSGRCTRAARPGWRRRASGPSPARRRRSRRRRSAAGRPARCRTRRSPRSG